MSSFRLLLAIAAELGLSVYGGDINTAYLNAKLAIRQYLRSINGYPCNVNGNVYVVLKALYGLRQSGREWNSELNQWLTDRGYQRSLTEPCLYYRFVEETIVYVLVYVDDILVATNNEQYKVKLFEGCGRNCHTKSFETYKCMCQKLANLTQCNMCLNNGGLAYSQFAPRPAIL
ncbi:unnamed protein product [Phytophthora fragariaefolia]|uniref:Unnamed protein product n=1 Tax=Phytophthora fragariaefolia TaxID=1490495 RepID=A0A9W6XZY3_9STRA|nr:unnamed protein product [Phytophthora fragariaefolia]